MYHWHFLQNLRQINRTIKHPEERNNRWKRRRTAIKGSSGCEISSTLNIKQHLCRSLVWTDPHVPRWIKSFEWIEAVMLCLPSSEELLSSFFHYRNGRERVWWKCWLETVAWKPDVWDALEMMEELMDSEDICVGLLLYTRALWHLWTGKSLNVCM